MIFPALLLAAAVSTAGTPSYAHHPVSTTDSQSQMLFDRGLTLFYAYNGSEGVHVFQTLEQREPKFAMAYWGEALGLGPDINTPLAENNFNAAHIAIEKAAALESGASEAERAYIEAMRVRYRGSFTNHDKAQVEYRKAMGAAFAKFPQDDDLGALYIESYVEEVGVNLWQPGTSLPRSNDAAAMTSALDAIIARNPQHIMANHLIVHIFEYSSDRTRAVFAADRLNAMPFAPEDEHLAHMPAHTYIDVGQYDKAVAASRRALALFDTYLDTPGIDPAHKGYIWHDITVGYTAAMMLGNYAQADWFGTRLSTNPSRNMAPYTLARFNRWTDLGNIVPTSATDSARFALAYTKLNQGDADGAKKELLDALDTSGPDSYLLYALRGAVQVLQSNPTDAQTNFAKAQTMENNSHGGENIPYFPTAEIMGGAYYRQGDYAAAEAAYRNSLKLYPNDARALYGLSQTLNKEARTAEAQSAAAQFSEVWQGSDTTLTPAGL